MAVDPGLSSPLDEGLDRISGEWEQQEEAGDIGQQARRQQNDAGYENEDGVKKLFGRHHAFPEVALDTVEDPDALQASQICSNDAGSEDQEQCWKCAETPSDFDEKSEFYQGNKDKHRQQDAEYFHGFMIAWAP